MTIEDDFEILNRNIRLRSNASGESYTVLDLHRWLQGLADDIIPNDAMLDITCVSPSTRHTDNIITLENGYNIDDAAATVLRDGSIRQEDGIYSSTIDPPPITVDPNAPVVVVHEDILGHVREVFRSRPAVLPPLRKIRA